MQLAGLILVLGSLAGCGSSSSSSTAVQNTATTQAATITTATTTTAAASTGVSSTSATSGTGPTLTIDYTSSKGWHFIGQVQVPQYQVSFSSDTSSSPPGQAQFSTSVQGPPPSPGRTTGIDTGLHDDNPGRPNGPTLVLGVELAYQLSPNSPGVQAGACATQGNDSSENVTSGEQLGYPFAFDMVCDPPDVGGATTQSGETDMMPQGQVASLVHQLTTEKPTYVLQIQDSDISDGYSCTLFLTPQQQLIKVTQAMIPPGANIGATSDCGRTKVTLG